MLGDMPVDIAWQQIIYSMLLLAGSKQDHNVTMCNTCSCGLVNWDPPLKNEHLCEARVKDIRAHGGNVGLR